MANITIKELKEKLSEYSDDMLIDKKCLDTVHELINIADLKTKYVRVHCDYYIPMNDIINGYDEDFREHIDGYSNIQDAITDWICADPDIVNYHDNCNLAYTIVDSIPEK